MADKLLKFPVPERTSDERLLDARWVYSYGWRRGFLWGLAIGFGTTAVAVALLLLH